MLEIAEYTHVLFLPIVLYTLGITIINVFFYTENIVLF